MKQTVYLHTFRDAFQAVRPNNFTYEGLEVLFDYLTELEDDIGQEMELDVIAICCDYCEDTWQNIASYYDIDLSDIEDEDEQKQAVMDWLCDNTSVCGETSDGSFVYCSSF